LKILILPALSKVGHRMHRAAPGRNRPWDYVRSNIGFTGP
jgi:hypothetical protein